MIRIRGARQNNLTGVDVDLPRNALIAVTGLSGSGKSSLAFDTLFREGQRRFLETLSAYARQFLGGLQKPDVESIEGLSPAIAVDQKSVPRGSRSTVGTLTEIQDHLRVLFARAGQAHCPSCELPLTSRTPEAVVQEILRECAGQKLMVLAPLVRDRKGQHKALVADLQKKGFVRARIDGEVVRLEEAPELERYKRHSIDVVVDRLKPELEDPARLREAVEQALELGEGDVIALPVSNRDGAGEDRRYSTLRTCPGCGDDVPPLEPRLFSFNSPHGACATCDGLGLLRRPTEAAVVRDPELSIREGALAVTRASGGAILFPKADFAFLERVGESHDFDLDTPWCELSARGKRVVLHGAGDERFADHASWNGQRFKGSVDWNRRYRGVLPALERAWRRGSRRKMVERFLSESTCPECHGSRINAAARSVQLGGVHLAELGSCPVAALLPRLEGLELSSRDARIARDLLSEIARRTSFLLEVGLGYLTLERGADTLSGGEAQRIRLAAQLGAGLQGVMYVLDEPSIGLHARDHGRLLGALAQLRDAGNTVVVVEHDEATLRSADWLVDVGPGAGHDGGNIVAFGAPSEVAKADTPTGRLLRGEIEIERPREPRAGTGQSIKLRGARGFNLKDVDVDIPLGALTVVSGVSGSGKSTLIQRTLARALTRRLGREGPDPGAHDKIEGLDLVDELVVVDAAPIGRTTRSNPATYTKVLTPIRDLFAALPESRLRGYTKSRFSFNVATGAGKDQGGGATGGGRCEACQGSGARYVELQFLAPVTVPCEECGGHRFQAETLDVKYAGHSISDILDMPVSESRELFKDHPKIARPLQLMEEVGLGYLTLGQPSTTISGGEAQRLKLVTQLSRRPRGHVLYLLDEPTTGLHMEDVGRLVVALQRLVDAGHTVVVIEHNLELVRAADHVIDLGPEGGEGGGEIISTGTPAEIAGCEESATGRALAELADARRQLSEGRLETDVVPETSIRLEGARTHNLKGISVEVPRESLTVVTGPSGSGKSSLALDTIYTEGRRRFVESLSTYARQFLGSKDRPPVERLEGLGPAVAVEARTVRGHPRSTVSTTTEVHDHLRVLWARAGQAHCPEHGEKLERSDASRVARRILKDTTAGGEQAQRGWLVAPIVGHGREAPRSFTDDLEGRVASWRSAGFARVLLRGAELRLEELVAGTQGVDWGAEDAPDLDLVIDRLKFEASTRARIAEAVEQAAAVSAGRVSVVLKGSGKTSSRVEYGVSGACTQCGFQLASELEPRHFSFNTHVGACKVCDGLGMTVACDEDLLVSDPDRALTDGAIAGKLGRYLTKGKGYYEMLLRTVARKHRIKLERPFQDLSAEHQELLMRGAGARATYKVELDRHTTNTDIHEEFTAPWPGLCGQIDAWHRKTDDPEWAGILESVMKKRVCPGCEGERLEPGFRAVTVGKRRLPQLLSMTVGDSLAWLEGLRLRARVAEAVQPVVDELRSRLALLAQVGLDYLTLDRSTATLSGGEARRVRLSASLGSQLVGVTYVLDEPTVGLHPQDVDKLTDALLELRDRGNTVLVVEHEEMLMRRADWIVDMGPGAGPLGGQVVAQGSPAQVMASEESLTAAFLRGELALDTLLEEAPSAAEHELAAASRQRGQVRLTGARSNNLRDVDFEARFGQLTGVCGPSGSGKSTLVLDTLVPAAQGERSEGRWRRYSGPAGGGLRTVVVDASPIGRTPHSVPATYTGLMQPLRELFARTPEARMRGYTAARFSFNSTKGRCPACEGRGAVLVEMQFLADLWLTCEECDGKRFRPETLAATYRGRSIADVLDMTVGEASSFLEHQPKIASVLDSLRDVGLGYMRLGQSSTTLSGGEAQRVKLATELMRAVSGQPALVVLDEPTTGLSGSDVVHLARVLRRLAAYGHAVVVVEHHTDLLGICEQLVELGPGGGEAGGRVICSGSPAELAASKASLTGPWLSLAKAGAAPGARSKTTRKRASARKATASRRATPKQDSSRKKAARKKATRAVRGTGS